MMRYNSIENLKTNGGQLMSVALVATMTTACAYRHDFAYTPTARAPIADGTPVAVLSVVDRRKDILEGDEPASWVGEQRSGAGIPYTVETAGEVPFADVVRDTLRRDLKAAGFEPVEAPDQAALATSGADRGLAIVVHVFNSNTYMNIDVEWDFEASVVAADGQVLAANRLRGKETLDGSAWDPAGAAEEKVPPFFHGLIQALVLGDAEMRAALLAEPRPTSRSAEAPTAKAGPGCSGDRDCKGNRVCRGGRCATP